jgi:hypothetical protein
MKLNELEHVLKAAIAADVTLALVGHAGIGKTERVQDTAKDWVDYWTDEKGILSVSLYCSTQEVTDLIGFPIQIWRNSGNPVIKGVKEEGPIDTSWAKPNWLPAEDPERDARDRKIMEKMKADGKSEEEITAFWNRPYFVLFLDELRRAPREVIQVMYPALTQKRLHTHMFPRGTRIVTADNPIGAYDTRDTDHAFQTRLCEINVEADASAWLIWAVEHNIHPKIRDFIASNPSMLHVLPEGLDKSVAHHTTLPDARKWGAAIDRIEKYAHYGLKGYPEDRIKHYKRVLFEGVVGRAVGGQYSEFTSSTISLIDILKGRASVKKALDTFKSLADKNKLREKLLIEFAPIMKNREFEKKECDNLKKFFLELDAGDKVVAMFQELFNMQDTKQLNGRWTKELLNDKEVFDLFQLFRNPTQ